MSSRALRRRRLAIGAVAIVVGVLLVAGGWALGRSSDGDGRTAPSVPRRAVPPRADYADRLIVGLVSRDVAALTPPAAGPIPGYDAARAVVDQLVPRHLRIDVRWDQLQPTADAPLDADRVTDDGCGRRGAPPCGPPISLRAVLAQVAAQQAAHPGAFRPLITFWGMPDWAAEQHPQGCGADRVRGGARPLAVGREGDYRAAIRAVWSALEQAGLRTSDWTPWNEPNAPYFSSPQRAACARDAAPRSPLDYARLVVAMDDELRALRGTAPSGRRDHRLVVGEVAAWGAPSSRVVAADELLRALPDDVLCRADVIGLHGYLDARPPAGRGEPVAAALGEVERRRCLDRAPVWITETGVGAPRSGGVRDRDDAVERAECRLMSDQLARWYRHPRIAAAFQYSVRDDAAFPVGLVDEAVRHRYPVADAWIAWGGERPADGPAPPLPADCGAAAEGRAEEAPPG